jgi:hypothetical protein
MVLPCMQEQKSGTEFGPHHQHPKSVSEVAIPPRAARAHRGVRDPPTNNVDTDEILFAVHTPGIPSEAARHREALLR